MNRSNSRSLFALALAAAMAVGAGTVAAQDARSNDPTSKQEPMTAPPPATTQATNKSEVLQARFDAMDKNHDGFLTKEEVGKDRQLSQNFAVWDSNSDGKISRGESDSHA
jgi:hypothetical protein